jgi:hypothetical protein
VVVDHHGAGVENHGDDLLLGQSHRGLRRFLLGRARRLLAADGVLGDFSAEEFFEVWDSAVVDLLALVALDDGVPFLRWARCDAVVVRSEGLCARVLLTHCFVKLGIRRSCQNKLATKESPKSKFVLTDSIAQSVVEGGNFSTTKIS